MPPRVSYFYDTEVGSFFYGQEHPMKPFRIKMAHQLIVNYGLYRKMSVYVSQKWIISSSTRLSLTHTDYFSNLTELQTRKWVLSIRQITYNTWRMSRQDFSMTIRNSNYRENRLKLHQRYRLQRPGKISKSVKMIVLASVGCSSFRVFLQGPQSMQL